MSRTLRMLFPAMLVAVALPQAASAERIAGVLEGSNVLVGFDSHAPATFTSLAPITGLTSSSERVVGLDYRHSPVTTGPAPAPRPGLYALSVAADGVTLRLYRIDVGTAIATAVGAPFSGGAGGARFGMDFNPAADRVRVVSSADASLRIHPDTGAVAGTDSTISPGGVEVTAVGYDRAGQGVASPPVPSNTTLFAIDNITGQFGTIGSVNGTPQSPNGGIFSPIGALGVIPDPGTSPDLDFPTGANGDVVLLDPPAFATIASGGTQRLYRVAPATGAATVVGETAARVGSIAVVVGDDMTFDEAYVIPGGGRPQAVRVAEAAGSATVTLSRPTSGKAATVSADWSASNGRSGTVSFAPGQLVASVVVPIADDKVVEPDETVTVTLGHVDFPDRGVGSPATITVADDDQQAVTLQPQPQPSTPPVPIAPDTTKPTVALGTLAKTITYANLTKKGVQVKVTPSEPVAFEAALVGSLKGGVRLRAVDASLAKATLPFASSLAARTVTLKPKAKDLRRPTKAVTVKVQLTATDAAGNRTLVTKSIKVKPR